MQSIRLIALTTATALVGFCANTSIALAQLYPVYRNPCDLVSPYSSEPTASTLRTVKLSDFGISIDIPSNYRAIKTQDGGVRIVRPAYFRFLQCIAKHGIRGVRGRGVDYISITPMTGTEVMSFLEMERQNGSNISPYNQGNLEGFITSFQVEGPVPMIAARSFVGRAVPTSVSTTEAYFMVLIACDCDIEMSELRDLLGRIKPLRQ
jgi:hypothetical protein